LLTTHTVSSTHPVLATPYSLQGERRVWDALTPAERQAVQTTQGMMQMVNQGMAKADELPGMLQRAGYDGNGVEQMMGLYEHANAVTPGLGKTPFNAALVRPGEVAELELSEEASAELKVRV